jgi:hypothetical protein
MNLNRRSQRRRAEKRPTSTRPKLFQAYESIPVNEEK